MAKGRKVVKPNGEIFRALLRRHDLTNAQAAEILRRPIKTVENWLSSSGAVNHRRMHDDTLEIFRMRLTAREKTNAANG